MFSIYERIKSIKPSEENGGHGKTWKAVVLSWWSLLIHFFFCITIRKDATQINFTKCKCFKCMPLFFIIYIN